MNVTVGCFGISNGEWTPVPEKDSDHKIWSLANHLTLSVVSRKDMGFGILIIFRFSFLGNFQTFNL